MVKCRKKFILFQNSKPISLHSTVKKKGLVSFDFLLNSEKRVFTNFPDSSIIAHAAWGFSEVGYRATLAV